MVQIIEQTREEKIKIYMKLSKKELAEMLASANIFIQSVTPTITSSPYNPPGIWTNHPSYAGNPPTNGLKMTIATNAPNFL